MFLFFFFAQNSLCFCSPVEKVSSATYTVQKKSGLYGIAVCLICALVLRIAILHVSHNRAAFLMF